MRIAAGLLLFATAFTVLQLTRATRQSATWDEPMHLTAGYAALAGDFRVDPSHPPLVRAWAALPLAISGRSFDAAVIDRTPVREWLSSGYAFARGFVSADLDWAILSGRAMVVMWGVLLGLFVFAWAFEWMGLPAAVLALGLYALEPNLAAHTALVTTDGALTVLVFGAVYFLWRYSRQGSWWNLAGVSACVALAFVTKFSAILLVPILGALLAMLLVRRTVTARQAALLVGATAAATVFAIWAAYGFRYAPSPNATWLLTRDSFGGTVGVPWLAATLEWFDAHHLLPNGFAEGLVFSLSSARDLPVFLGGEVRTGGWWYYFPVAVAIKTPLAILALAALGVVLGLRHVRDRTAPITFIVLPIAIWLAAAAVSGVNLGVRHVLPIYPFLVLLAAGAAADLLARRRPARVVVALVVAMLVAEVGRAEPYPLSFFNALAGGPENGFRHLADSNLGWGGNLKALKRWMDARGIAEVNLVYFGSVDPAQYGIRATYLPSSTTFLTERIERPRLPGYVAISGTSLDGVYLPEWWRLFYAGFRDRTPAAVVANTMRIYWVEEWPESPEPAADPESVQVLADGLLFGLRWPEHAVKHYDEYLRHDPRDPDAWNGRSVALAQTGRSAEAIDGFRRVLALSPSDPAARRNITLLEQAGRVSIVQE